MLSLNLSHLAPSSLFSSYKYFLHSYHQDITSHPFHKLEQLTLADVRGQGLSTLSSNANKYYFLDLVQKIVFLC